MDPPGPGPGSKPRPKPAPSSVSLRSDLSKDSPLNFKEGSPEDQSSYNMDPPGPGPGSKPRPKPAPSSVSLRSDRSKDQGPGFRETPPEDQREPGPKEQLDAILTRLEEDVLTFVKEQLQRLHRLLVSEDPESSSESEEEQSSREAVLNITLDFLRRMKQEQLAERLSSRTSVGVYRDELKRRLQQRFSCVFEGVAKAGNPAPLRQIYTELYIREGGASEVNQEHEVRLIETASRKPAATETSITCEELFKGPAHRQQPIRAELTEERPIRMELTEERPIRMELTEERPIRTKDAQKEPIRAEKAEGNGKNIPRYKEHKKSRFKNLFQSTRTNFKKAPLPIRTELTEERPIRMELTEERPIRMELTEERPIRAEQTEKQKPVRPGYTKKIKKIDKTLKPIRADLKKQRPIRTVLTKGVAGVGKTVLTQKFSLDWAEGRANQDIQLLFPFTFRELNVLRDTEYSLVGLLHHFFSPTKGLCSFQQLQVLFIFDGLDECRLPLDFSRTRVLTEPTESASVEVLLVNLIRGSLLPFARLWITTRPAAANQIPAECVSMVTEVRGFTDPQKEQYFRKRFTDQQQATAIISHIKRNRSLYIMCHLPVYCWITSTVLLHLMKNRQIGQLPTTLTQMYVHFLVVQAKVKNIKYHEGTGADLPWTPETREMVRSLGKLAFEQLHKGNLIFYERDLSQCGLDAAAASVYSGVFTQVFREESGLYQDKVYCFIHLSVQEFLAALHVHQTFFSSGENLLSTPHSSESPETFYRSAVDQALQSPNGHLDLFLRFLLGLSLPTNQSLLPGQLTHTGSDSTNQKTVKYIREKLNEEGLSGERSLNLLHCLNELNHHNLVEMIQIYMREGRLSFLSSPAEWSTVSFLLLSSDLEEFDLRKYCSSETVLLKLLPVVKASTKAILRGCGLSSLSCGPLTSVLSSSSLTLLDLSNNDLQDSGVELLCSGLKSAPCRLHTLRLSGCLVSERGGASLASALSSAPSHLRELDLSYNHPGPSTELLTALRAPHGPLDSLRLDPAGEQWMVPGLRKYSCEFSLDPNTAQRNLLLSEDNRTVTRVTEEQQYPHHEDRFMEQPQVLSSTGLRGRCYWEVKWRKRREEEEEIGIAVSYRGIRRRGHREERRFGDNDQSWRLRIYGGEYYVCHNNRETHTLSSFFLSDIVGVSSDVVGVFLDSEAGALSFYEVVSGGELFHVYTFTSSFTEPLFPGFTLKDEGSSVSVVDLRRAPPGGPL